VRGVVAAQITLEAEQQHGHVATVGRPRVAREVELCFLAPL
jgi:hypothetical protein